MDWRKYGQIGYKMVVGAAGVYMAWMLLRVVTQVFFFASFSIRVIRWSLFATG